MSKLLLLILFTWIFIIALTKNQKVTTFQSLMIVTLLTLVIVLRDGGMADYQEYVRIYNYQVESVEPIHVALIRFLNSLDFRYLAYFFIIGLSTVLIQWNAIKRMIPNYWALSLLTWLGTSFILNDMVTIRAGLAAALSLWVIYFKANNEILKCFIMIVIATCCHMSAAILIICLFISAQKTHKKLYLSCLIGSILFPILGISLTDYLGIFGVKGFDDKILVYLEDSEANVFSMFQILKFSIAIILWLNVDKFRRISNYFLMPLKVYTIGCIWFFVTYKIMAISWRISCVLWTCDLLIYPFIAFILSRKMSPQSKLIPATLGLILFYVNLTMQQYWNPI